MKFIAIVTASLLIGLLGACTTASQQAADVAAGTQDRMALGTVQQEIRVGMSGAAVTAALGAPNIVTTDEQRREVWVYDRMATENVYSTSRGGVGVLLLGGIGGSTGAAATTQRTLTVIIKFDEGHRVRDFAYRSSSF